MMGFGLATKELFMYNREGFQFDQEQRIEQDILRMEMQVKRFELMREDVRDLVELTSSRMDIFHVVGALFLHFCIALFCEGRMKGAPAFLVAMFFLSNASAFLYLLLAVWLSMHATVASHSFGVRLLTRFVRLPIPSSGDLDQIAAKLANYEQRGLLELLRLPFDKSNDTEKDATSGDSSSTFCKSTRSASHSEEEISRGNTMRKSQSEAVQAAHMTKWSRGIQPGQHVRLFHELQGKWQPYDAYCRVCMYLGVMQILNTLTYFIIHHTLVENNAPGVGFSLVLIFQIAAMAISDLDMTGIKQRNMRLIDFCRLMPCVLTLIEIVIAPRDHKNGQITPSIKTNYYFAPLCMVTWCFWLYLLLEWVVKPSKETGLPWTMKSMQFLDVFKDSQDPSTQSSDTAAAATHQDPFNPEELQMTAMITEVQPRVVDLLALAREALGRWRAVPHSNLSTKQRREVGRLEILLQDESNKAQDNLAKSSSIGSNIATMELGGNFGNFQGQGKLLGTLVGPLQVEGREVYYSVERDQLQDEVDASAATKERPIVTLEFLKKIVEDVVDAGCVLQRIAQRAVFEAEEFARLAESNEEAREAAVAPPTRWRRVTRVRTPSEDGVEMGEVRSSVRSSRHSGATKGSTQTSRQPRFEPEMLPWHVLQWTTKCLQGALAVSFVFLFMQEFFDLALFKAGAADLLRIEERRLQVVFDAGAQPWRFAEWTELSWPHGAFFRPVGASCHGLGEAASLLRNAGGLPIVASATNTFAGVVVVSSAYAHYVVADVPDVLDVPDGPRSSVATQLLELRSVGQSPGAQLFCAATGVANASHASTEPPCLWGALEISGGVSLQEFGVAGSAVMTLPGDNAAWRLFTGALVGCAGVADFMPDGSIVEEWCLLMAGWDGERLGVVAQPLSGGPSGRAWSPHAGSRVSPQADVPLPEGEVEVGFQALHLEPSSLRLWAITTDGHLAAWDLRDARSHGRWEPRWLPTYDPSGPFQPEALCEAAGLGLVVVGRDALGEPRLLAAALPDGLRGEETWPLAAENESEAEAETEE